jgi:hypothetical protein
MGLDSWTAVAMATHDWETDRDTLLTALPSEAGYVAVLGSRRRLSERLARQGAMGGRGFRHRANHRPARPVVDEASSIEESLSKALFAAGFSPHESLGRNSQRVSETPLCVADKARYPLRHGQG